MAVPVAQIQPHYLLRLALHHWAPMLLFATLLHGWSPFLHPRVRIESLASDEASRLIPSKAVNAWAIYGTVEAVPFVKSLFPIWLKPSPTLKPCPSFDSLPLTLGVSEGFMCSKLANGKI
jgi:hypothetical protein